jgi:fibronectin-binding autotransporter adhesin
MGRFRTIGMTMAIAVGSVGTVSFVAVATAPPSAAAACTDSWQGPTTGVTDWNASASNWSTGFPTSGGVTCVGLAGTYTVTIRSSVNLGTLQVGGGASGKQTVQIDGSTTDVGVDLASPSTVGNRGALVLTPSAGFALLSGAGGVTVPSGGTFATSGPSNIAYIRTGITNQAGGTVTVGAASTIQDSATSTSNAGAFGVASGGGLSIHGGSTFTNSGAMTLTGTMQVATATFTQSGGSISGNPVDMVGNGTLVDSVGTGSFDVTGSTSLSGVIPVGQTVTVDGSVTDVLLNLTADTTVSGVLNLNPSIGFAWLNGPGAVSVASGGVLASGGSGNVAYLRTNINNRVGGTVALSAANTHQDQGTTTTNNGTFTVASGGAIVASGGGGITNAGTMTLTGTMTIGNATFTQTSGSISGNPVVLTGNSVLTDSAGTGAFDVTGTTTLNGAIPVGQSVTVDGSVTNVTLSLPADTTVSGVLNLNPSIGFAWLNGPGAVNVASGGVLASGGSGNVAYLRTNINNQAGGTVAIAAPDARMDQGTTMTNSGTFQVADGGHLSLSGGSTLTNTGILGTTVNATGPTTSGITGGAIAAGGTLKVVTVGSPTIGTVFSPIGGTTLTGSFSNLEYGAHGYATSVNGTSVSITATALPFSVVAKTFSATSHQPGSYSVATVTTISGKPTYQATINWGDSTSSSGSVVAGKVKGTHSYAAPGPYVVTVTVHASNGTTLSTSKSTTVKVDPIPTVTSVMPTPVVQGTNNKTLTVLGTGFTDNSVATFSATGFTVVSSTYVSPTHLAVKVNIAKTAILGAGNITITTPGGPGTCTACLTVDAAPKITKILPVPVHGATTGLTVTGSGFQAGLVVSSTVTGATFGAVTGQTATTFSIQITIPVTTAPGAYTITVVNPDGGKVVKALTVT